MEKVQFEALLRHLTVQNALLYQIVLQMRGENPVGLKDAMGFLAREGQLPPGQIV